MIRAVDPVRDGSLLEAIVDVFRRLGFEPFKPATWQAGSWASRVHRKLVNILPESALHPKTNGRGGSHQHRHYPPEFIQQYVEPICIEVIKDCRLKKLDQARQLEMDFRPGLCIPVIFFN
jgi:hypothetical protein